MGLFQANAIGRGAKSVREFLEKNYTDEAIETDDLTIKLVIKALLEVSVHVKAGRGGPAVGHGPPKVPCSLESMKNRREPVYWAVESVWLRTLGLQRLYYC
jgi:hypothetical protein